MHADPSTWALLAIVPCSIVLTNPTSLALCAKVTAALMNALPSQSALPATWFIVFAETSPSTMGAAPLEVVMRTILWGWPGRNFNTRHGSLYLTQEIKSTPPQVPSEPVRLWQHSNVPVYDSNSWLAVS